MTVRVNDVVGVAGFALPGNYVDVVVNAQQEQAGKMEDSRQISKTVRERAGPGRGPGSRPRRNQTQGGERRHPRAEPGDAEKLDLARSVGNLSLVLRNQIDKDPTSTVGITKHQLFGTPEPVPAPVKVAAPAKPVMQRARPAPQASTATCVEVIQGGARTLNCF
jgi:pilus assembly protein CpaB